MGSNSGPSGEARTTSDALGRSTGQKTYGCTQSSQGTIQLDCEAGHPHCMCTTGTAAPAWQGSLPDGCLTAGAYLMCLHSTPYTEPIQEPVTQVLEAEHYRTSHPSTQKAVGHCDNACCSWVLVILTLLPRPPAPSPQCYYRCPLAWSVGALPAALSPGRSCHVML